jgi:hypothetical protein
MRTWRRRAFLTDHSSLLSAEAALRRETIAQVGGGEQRRI